MRRGGERSTHVDCLEWEKGREVSFNSASLFFTKVASGNVGVMRSRDLKVLPLGFGQLPGGWKAARSGCMPLRGRRLQDRKSEHC